MRKKNMALTQEILKKALHYDHETGVFTWNIKISSKANIGDIAGRKHKPNDYLNIYYNGILYGAHRLAFLYMEGYLPEHMVDHKNGICDDNRWSNLRHATSMCNSQNQKKFSNNTSGYPGVFFDKKADNWRSMITIKLKNYHIGSHNDPLEAALARFTVKTQCELWTCNYRSELVKSIKNVWPEFSPR